jgi:vitamin B12 transporter
MKYFLYTIIYFSTFLNLQAQGDTLQLSPVTVTAALHKNEIKNTARNISIIDQKTISTAPVKTLDGILQYALNVDVRSRTSFGVQADISIRGGHYDQTLILVDGVKVNDPQTGHHALNLPVPFSSIEKIEVLQGGASRVFGPSAFSGVINIITKKPQKSTGELSLGAGSFGTWQVGGNAAYVNKGFSVQAGGDYGKSDGYQPSTHYKKHTLSLQAEQTYKHGTVLLQYGNMSNAFGAANFYHPKFYNQYEEVSSQLINTAWKQQHGKNLQSTLMANYRQHLDMYDFDNYRNTNKLSSLNVHRSGVLDIEWKFRYKTGTAFGLEYRKETVRSNRLGEELEHPEDVKGWPSLQYNRGKSRDNYSLFGEQQWRWHRWHMNAGTLANIHTEFGFSLFPGLDVAYSLNSASRLYYSVNRSLRFPTFTELYLNNNTITGDPDLKPEKAWTQEIGYKYQHSSFLSTLSLFYTDTRDALDKVKRPGIAVPLMENMDHLKRYGLEIGSTWNLRNHGLRQLSLNYAAIQADRKEEGFQSFYTLNYLKHKLSAGALFEPLPSWTLSLWYTLKDRAGQYSWDDASPALDYETFGLMDFRTAYTWRQVSLRLDINNVLNKKYFEYGFVQQPPRALSASLIYRIY